VVELDPKPAPDADAPPPLELDRAGVMRQRCWLVRDVSATIHPRRVTALVGPNGAGKSTLIRIAAGIWQADEGVVRLAGRDIRRWSGRARARRVALAPQDAVAPVGFTVQQIVALGRYAHRGRVAGETDADNAAVRAALSRTDLAGFATRRVARLSGGERQRVLLARALATEAPIVLLDEPTANLDVGHALNLLRLARELADEGRTIVIALHDLDAAWRFADDAMLLNGGTLVAAGPARDVLTPERIGEVFHVEATRIHEGAGARLLLDLPRRPSGSTDGSEDQPADPGA